MFNLSNKNPFGLDISDSSIEVLHFGRKFGKIKLAAYGRIQLEPGIVKNGTIYQKEKLAKNITKLLENTFPRPIEAKQAIISLPESKVFTHIFQLPKSLSTEQIKDTLKYEAREVIPFNFDDVYWDFQIVSEKENKKGVFFAASPKKIVKAFKKTLQIANLTPLVFDMESLALQRSLIKNYKQQEEILITDIGSRTTILSIFDKNGLYSTMNIPIAGNNFTKAISNSIKTSLQKAEEIKLESEFSEEQKERILSVIKPLLDSIILDIKKSVEYYQNQEKIKIKKILLSGGSSLILGLPEYFSQKLNLKIEIVNVWKGIDVNSLFKKNTKIKPILFSTACGLALRGIEKNPKTTGINLLY